MSRRNTTDFQTIHSEGGLLPPDLLRRILDPKGKIPGTQPEDYGLPKGERINEVITQSWNRLRRHWAEFREAAAHLPGGDAGTGLTNDKWNLPVLRELGFGMLPTSPGPEIGGRTYAINRFFGPAAIHMIGCGLSLDRRAAGARGAALVNPHGLVQEFLNRSEGHLWAIVSNGLRLRILRDNQALSRQSYLEFDLEAMFNGEVFSDFVLLWLMGHATRFAVRDEGKPETCWLEQWTKIANEQGARALESLRGGVERALQVLGQGFVGHPKNTFLREALRSGQVSLSDFHGQLLRVVYRLIFLFVTEDRSLEGISLLHPRDDSEEGRVARERYAVHYSTARLRELASRIKGSRHGDLWQQFNLLVGALSGKEQFEAARTQLALPALGSFLWSPESTSAINAACLAGADGTDLTNADFLDALRHLAFVRQDRILRPVDYKNLGAEELGGVYESLLALTPQISGDGNRFTFAEFAGNQRKTSGSYYTPDCLVQCLLDSALDPVVEEAIKGKTGVEAEQALLALKVCDPACGSGHFLVGAAHRLARHLARVRALAQGDSEPSPTLYQTALRDVIGHCIYGVDINPMAVELCKVSLWLEALEPGKPLSFLDHHIQCGNSLIGATPALLKQGIPDDAFKPIKGDDKEFCTKYKKRNKEERVTGQEDLFDDIGQPWQHLGNLGAAMLDLDRLKDDTVEALRAKEEAYARHVQSTGYLFNKFLHDAWCAAFVWIKTRTEDRPYPITQQILNRIERNPHDCTGWMREEIVRLAQQYQFFHWHLAFPDIFRPLSRDACGGDGKADSGCIPQGWTGGFDVLLGNPPWERVKLQEKEWFAERSPEIANAPNAAARKRMINDLVKNDPALHQAFQDDLRKAEGESHFMRNSGKYPLCGRGDINLYAVFAELNLSIMGADARTGCIVPTGIATDDSTKVFFQHIVTRWYLNKLISFENAERIFNEVKTTYRFSLLTLTSSHRLDQPARFSFFLTSVDNLHDSERQFSLTQSEIMRLNPNTLTCPVFRTHQDASLAKAIYAHSPVLWVENVVNGNSLGVSFQRMFDMTNDADLFNTREQLEQQGVHWDHLVAHMSEAQHFVMMWEDWMVHHFDHRYQSNGGLPSTLSDYQNPFYGVEPRYWIENSKIQERVGDVRYMFGFRNRTNATDSRSVIGSIVPVAAAGNTLPVIYSDGPYNLAWFAAAFSSYVLDYCARQKIGGMNLNYFIAKQLPVPPLPYETEYPLHIKDFWIPIFLELTYTAWDLEAFAQDCSWNGPPFRWDEERRFLLRCELDAAFFHLYLPATASGEWRAASREDGCPYDETPEQLAELKKHFPTPRHAVDYIMDTFPIVKRRDEATHGYYRTKDTILEIYDAMQRAIATGEPYQTLLDPAPGAPCDTQGNFISMYQFDRDNWPPHIHPVHPDWEESLLSSWFDVCQKRWQYLEDDQIFPWDGRETFICALIPYLVKERPGEKFEFYRDAALLASRSIRCEALLLADTLRAEYRQALDGLDWLHLPDTHRIRPHAIREALQNKRIIQTDAKTGTTTLADVHRLPPLPPELKPLLPLIMKAADTLDRLQRRALEDAEAAKLAFTYDEISKEFTAMSVA